jgi:hypothetical protein
VDKGGGTVTDNVTGLVWQRKGTPSLYYWEAQKRIEKLNSQKFGGHETWRIPTLEEMCSLLDSAKKFQRYYSPSVFDNAESPCWSSDVDELDRLARYKFRFSVDFSTGEISSFPSADKSFQANGCFLHFHESGQEMPCPRGIRNRLIMAVL